jgi:Carboxypeptidase regulatory-like domain/TonB dependent receptor
MFPIKIQRFFTLSTAILLIAFGVRIVNGQQNVSGASLGGNIVDQNGASIAGAAISATDVDKGYRSTVLSDANGRFRFSYLAVGNYEVRVEHDGFATATKKITTTVGQALEFDLVLSPKTVSVQVEVTGQPVIETARVQMTETILPRNVEDLPLNGRNFVDLALLIPAVSRTNTGNVQRFAETSAVPGTGISVAGQRNLATSFVVDGSSANDDSVELAGTYYGQDVIREFQVVTSGAVAEFGRASGGFINIVTKSGANEFTGDVLGFLRSERFDARNPLATSRDPLTQVQYGGSLGGPVVRDRTFFFANFEQTRRHDSNIITITPGNVTAINNRLNAAGFRGPRIETGLVPGGYNTSNFFGRIDHKIDKKNSFAVTYNFYDIDATNARTVGGLNSVSRGTNLNNRDHTINTQNVTTFGSQTLNEFRFQYRNSRLGAPPIDLTGPAVNISGVASFGTSTTSPTRRDIDLYQFSDSVSTYISNHSLKGGVEYTFNDLEIGFPGAIQGVYTFTNLANFLAGSYSQFQQAFGSESQHQRNPNTGFFVQDEWKARRELTLNFGLRYDLQFLPLPIRTDRDNISPRLGFAWSPDAKTVVRGSFGIYYDRIPTRATSNALQRDGTKYIVAILGPTSAGAPVFPNILAAPPSVLVTKPAITRIDPDIENNSSHQANIQIERELPFDTSFSAGYIYLRGIHIILSRNVNVPRCTAAVDPNLCRPEPNFGNISRFEGSGNSRYDGLVLSLNKRQGKWMSARASYTLSKARDDSGNFFFSTPQDNFDRAAEWGRSDNDQRHRFVVSGTFDTPEARGPALRRIYGDFQLGWIFTYASRLPFNIVTGNDRNGDTTNNDRPAGVGRNTGPGFDHASLDLRLSRRFSFTEKAGLLLLAEGFNVLNRSNLSVPNNTFGTGTTPLPAFGRATAAFDPRQFQLGFRLEF